MTTGPPPNEAGPSSETSSTSSGTFQAHSNVRPYYQNFPSGTYNAGQWRQENGQQDHAYHYPQNWTGNWPQAYPYPQTGPSRYASAVHGNASTHADKAVATEQPIEGSSPVLYNKHWDEVIKGFLKATGLTQALRGFEADMLVINPDAERKVIPSALKKMKNDLERIHETSELSMEAQAGPSQGRPLEKRKLDHVHLENGAEPRSPTSVTKSISRFLAQNRARNDASNRQEFLLSLAEKRRRLNEDVDGPVPSCARTDAKTQNRDLQMKYDIARNEDGPLRKTMKASWEAEADARTSQQPQNSSSDVPTARRYPGLDERLRNIETHLAVRYVPSPPYSLLDRLRFLEDHIIHLEKEYPPWAALHFNQPNRGWPSPPRQTPIIVPSHLTSTSRDIESQSGEPISRSKHTAEASESVSSSTKSTRGKTGGRQKSSLHRAVMERLEVQKAMNDLAGEDRDQNDPSRMG